MNDENDTKWHSARFRIAIRSFQFMLGTSATLLLYGMFYPNGVATLLAMKEIIYTVGGTYSVIVTGYMGLDVITRLRGNKSTKEAEEKSKD